MYLLLAALGLGCCARAFSRRVRKGLLSVCGLQASHCSVIRFRSTGSRACGPSSCRSRAPDHRLSSFVAHGLSCSAACGILPDKGLNLRLLHWQADSLPLSHRGSPEGWDLRARDELGLPQPLPTLSLRQISALPPALAPEPLWPPYHT